MKAEARYIKLVTEGRLSGLPHVVELRYILLNDAFYVAGADGTSDWVLNSLASKRVKVRLGDWAYISTVSVATDEERQQAMQRFAQKYGAKTIASWYPNSSTVLRLVPQEKVRRGATAEGAATMTYSEWRWSDRRYYDDVAGAFDSASEEYDFTIGRNFINTWIRRRSIAVLMHFTRSDDVLVEIGCGTGAEALEISRMVRAVVATDISGGMIDLLRKKLSTTRGHGEVIPLRLGASEILRARDSVPGGKVRVAYSFNGALNCEPDLPGAVAQLSGLLEPGGHFVCSVRNTFCLSEFISHVIALQFDRATPRKRQPVMISVGGIDIPSYYYSPGEFSRRFRAGFELEQMFALPGIIPPAYLSEYYLKFRDFTAGLEKAELALSGSFPFNRFGDQTLFVFRRAER